MLTFYATRKDSLQVIPRQAAQDYFSYLVWVDLYEPTPEEEAFVEKLLRTSIPTRDEMHEIELSSRLYQKNGVLYATATILTHAETAEPEAHAITFVLSHQCLITVRYSDPMPFRFFRVRVDKKGIHAHQGNTILTALMEALVDRMADILESASRSVDTMAKQIFRPHLEDKAARAASKPDLEEMLRQIGITVDLISKTRESLVSITRLLSFISHTIYFPAGSDEHTRVHTLQQDIPGLNDHASFLSNKVNFILDATLGMINMEQNGIIKIFSVAAVVFLPPTLVASIYGMNFHHMPELDWWIGYPFALCLMVLSVVLPYRFFRKKGWL